MGKTERKRIAFFLVCIMLLGMFGNIFVAFAESGDGSEVVMMEAGSMSGGAIDTPALPTTSAAASSSTPSATPTETPIPTETSTSTPTLIPTETPIPTGTTAPTETPTPTPIETLTPTPTETPTPTPTVTPTPTETLAPPTETPVPSNSPVPTIPPDSPIGIATEPSITEPTAEPYSDPVKKKLTILLGKSLSFDKLFKDKSAVKKLDKVTLKNPGKYRKYFQIKLKKGKIVTKQNYVVKIKKKIKIYVTLKGKKQSYPVLVTLKIPKPKVKIRVKKYNYFGERGYDFIFHYNIPKAKKIQVRLAKIKSRTVSQYFDKYISARKSNRFSHVRFSNTALKRRGKKLTFRIVAYYGKGKNKSEVLKITKKVK